LAWLGLRFYLYLLMDLDIRLLAIALKFKSKLLYTRLLLLLPWHLCLRLQWDVVNLLASLLLNNSCLRLALCCLVGLLLGVVLLLTHRLELHFNYSWQISHYILGILPNLLVSLNLVT